MEIALDFFKSVGAYLQDVNLGGYNMCALPCYWHMHCHQLY